MFCFNPEFRKMNSDIWGDVKDYDDIPQCDPIIIDYLSKISIVEINPTTTKGKGLRKTQIIIEEDLNDL